MKLYAPAYYKEFSCIADRCRHSCCIGWEIDVDADTLAFYEDLEGDYADKIRASIDRTDEPHFSLSAHDRCPHLDKKGLCRIITHYGHEALCDICREHPRFYHQTPQGMEVGLGLSCEQACRIVLQSDDYARMIEIEDLPDESEDDVFDATALRAKVYALLQQPDVSYTEKLQNIYSAFRVAPALCTDEQWRTLLDALEYLNKSHRALFAPYSSDLTTPPESEPLLTRALAYFIFRHCTQAVDAQTFRASLGLALFFERLLCSMIKNGAEPYEAARILSEELEYSEENTLTILLKLIEVLP